MLDRLSPVESAYNLGCVLRLEGELDVAALRGALNEVVRRHQVLRTRFGVEDGAPVQVIAAELELALEVEDLGAWVPGEGEIEARRQAQAEAHAGFDLERGPLIRARLLRLRQAEHWLLLSVHHIVFDGWSVGVLARELTVSYSAYRLGVTSPLAEPPVQYADYAVWQRQWLQGEILDQQLAYWKQALSELAVLDLPTDRVRPAQASYRGARVAFELGEELTRSLKALSRREGATLFMTLLAAFQVLLHRYSGQEDVAVGVPIAGRSRPELEGLIGFFVNTLVLRGDLSGGPSFKEYLARVRARALEAYEHQELPFEKLVEELAPRRDLSRNPLFQVSLGLQNTPPAQWQLEGLQVQRIEGISNESAQFDLSLTLTERADRLLGSVEYVTDLFNAATIERMLSHWQVLLEGIVADPQQRISRLPLLTQAEREQLLVQWNNTVVDYPRDQCIHQLFEAQVARTPQATAVVFGEQEVSYAELNRRANQLAHRLRTLGVRSDVLVGLCVERSLELVVGLLGILKAGGAYVPLDPSYLGQRLAFMLQDTQPPVLLTQQRLLAQLPAYAGHTLCLDRDWSAIAAQLPTNPECIATATNLAYVNYTSGSTGQPNGVMIEHRSVVNYLLWIGDAFPLTRSDRLLQKTPLSFDASAEEILCPLVSGALLVIAEPAVHHLVDELVLALQRHRITVLQVVPSLLASILDHPGFRQCRSLRLLLCGAEILRHDLVKRVPEQSSAQLVNLYGPTETTISSTFWTCRADADQDVPIGRPIANTQVVVVDRWGQLVPTGVAGELWIGGAGVARGYLNRPALTSQRFVQDSFGCARCWRWYRSGDRVRYLADGNLAFLGRDDEQVKIRGFRVEPAEIEAALVRHVRVRDALVVLREDVPGDPQLVAYVVGRGDGLAAADLRALLTRQLPNYMIPAAYVLLPALPLTPNGKIDRRALPPPGERDQGKSGLIAPRDKFELHLLKIWEDLLKLGSIGVRDNFFDLGGHSLLVVQLMDRIDKAFHRHLSLDTLWLCGATIEAMAQVLRDASPPGPDAELVLMKKGSRRPLFIVHTLGGNLFHYYDLARHLDAEQTVYGLQARGVYGTGRPDHTIEAIATHCIESMRIAQLHGPYLVAGLSSGGVVAFEVAQQLAAAGQRVALLAMLDTYAPKAGTVLWWIDELAALRRRKLNLRQLQELAYFSVLHPLNLDRLRRLRTIGEAHRWAHWSYRPRPYAHPIEFFVAKDSTDRAGTDTLGWVLWANGSVRVHRLPGSHSYLVKLPVVKELAARLQACIDGVTDN